LVAEILESWRSLEGKRFRVRTLDDQIFDLLYEAETDAWSIEQK